jgi:hypothetical protein
LKYLNFPKKGNKMKRSAAVLIIVSLILGSSALAIEATGTFAEARALAAQQSKPLLVDFFTTW